MKNFLYQHHNVFGYKYISNLNIQHPGREGLYTIETNSQGFRYHKDFCIKQDSVKKRILLFGDSFTAADSISNEYRYSDLVESHFDHLEIYNYAMPGIGTDQQFLIFQEECHKTRMEYDLVIIAVLIENIKRVNAEYRIYLNEDKKEEIFRKPFFKINNGELELRNVPLSQEPLALVPDSETKVYGGMPKNFRSSIPGWLKDLIFRIGLYQPIKEYSNETNDEWLLMSKILSNWINLCKSPVIIMPIPLHHFYEGNAKPIYLQRFHELTNQTNSILVDPLPHFRSRSTKEIHKIRLRNDTHPSKYGHKLLSEVLIRELKTLNL